MPAPAPVSPTYSLPPALNDDFDVMALWSLPARPVEEEIPFGFAAATATAEPVEEPPPVWRLQLPADDRQANQRITRAEASLRSAQIALDQADLRLQALVQTETAAAEVDYGGIAATPMLPEPELELLDMLQAAESQDVAAPEGVASFGLFDSLPTAELAEAREELEGFLEQLRRFVAHYAWVETEVGGRLIGRTAVTWTGDFRTLWPDTALAGDRLRHDRSLQLALATRTTMLRTFVVVTTGAVTILPLLTNPGSAILSLPAIWKFIKRIRSEIERYNQLTQEN